MSTVAEKQALVAERERELARQIEADPTEQAREALQVAELELADAREAERLERLEVAKRRRDQALSKRVKLRDRVSPKFEEFLKAGEAAKDAEEELKAAAAAVKALGGETVALPDELALADSEHRGRAYRARALLESRI
jgi:hypothetical protein